MKYLLDTDICVYVINERPRRVLDRFVKQEVGEIGVSSVTAAELAFGVAKSGSQRNRQALEAFLLPLKIADFDLAAAFSYGEVRTFLEGKGQVIGPLDMLIAAHAKSLGATLVTNNLREFKHVPGLAVENWAT